MPTVREIYEYINSFAPFSSQESWDNSGLLLGNPEKEVDRILFALDATPEAVQMAKSGGAQMIITHHPVIFSPLKKITSDSVVYELISSGISAVCAHTCWDSAEGGVNDTLAEVLGFKNPIPLELKETATPMVRLVKVKPMTGEELAKLVCERLGCHLRLADAGNMIQSVAICGGSGGSLLYGIIGKADAFITGELSHHHFLDAQQNGLTAIAAGHFETELPSMRPLAEKTIKKFPEIKATLFTRGNPVKYY